MIGSFRPDPIISQKWIGGLPPGGNSIQAWDREQTALGLDPTVTNSDLGALQQRREESAAAMDRGRVPAWTCPSEVRLGVPARIERSESKVQTGKMESRSAQPVRRLPAVAGARKPNNGGIARE